MAPANFDLANKTAIITGSAHGIGRAIAERLVESNARVAVTEIDISAAQATALEIGSSALPLEVDVASAESVESMTQSLLKEWGRIDILVNNAGIVGRDVPVSDLTEDDWDTVMDINLKGVFLCSRAVIGAMMERGKGNICSVASVSGKEGNPNMTPYSVSKAGVICFTKALAKEVLEYDIRVNCVSPALIETRLIDGMEQQQLDYMTSKIPMGRLGKPSEVAALVHFLVSDESSFTTGQCLDISGGRSTY